MSFELSSLPSGAIERKEDAAEIAKVSGATYLGRLSVMAMQAKPVMNDKIKAGQLAIVWSADQVLDLTKSCDVLFLARRVKAMSFGPPIINVYDAKDKEFQRIRDDADASGYDSGCSYGPEYLVWVRGANKFAGLFCNNKTLRRGSAEINRIMDDWVQNKKPPFATLTSSKKTDGKNTWFGIDTTRCSTPFETGPTKEEVDEQVHKFLNPPVREVESADVGRDR